MKDIIAYLYSTGYKISELKNINLENVSVPENFINFCKENKIGYLIDKEIKLKKTKPLPYVLYYSGNLDLLNKYTIGIVGPRKITFLIKHTLEKFFEYLQGQDIVIVSGLAMGTDEYAHKLALKYNIPTIGILGMGFKPALNSTKRHLINEIISKNGLILSEFRLNQAGTTWTFPQRNRIIAGLSDILFVPQAAEKSGTLITINKALEYKVPVYSCFSSYLDEMGKGTNSLIKQGKVKGLVDLEELIGDLNIKKPQLFQLSVEEDRIVDLIKQGVNTLDLLLAKSNMDFNILIQKLSELELKGIISENAGEYFLN